MSRTMANALYNAALWLIKPFYVAKLKRRARDEPAYGKRIRERFGFYRKALKRAHLGHNIVWVHAVSLGETRAAAPLVAALRQRFPWMRLLLTCSTATGVQAGRELLQDEDIQTWLPYDSPRATRRFLAQFEPVIGIVMETEVWPNLLREAKAAGVPMVLANARLSPASLAKGQRFGTLLSPAMASFEAVLAQSIPDAQRLREAGSAKVEVSGHLKFDVTPPAKLLARGLSWRMAVNREVVLMAVSREGEEAMLLDAWVKVPTPRPLLLIVPRHPQRFSDVARMVHQKGLSLSRRSEWDDKPGPEHFAADVWLGDTMGEMPVYYATADVALLGGSFAPFGGQNLIEAAACGCPVVLGPHTYNFAEASELALQARAALRVDTLEEGLKRAIYLAHDPERNGWVERAFNFAAQHRGATDRMANRIAEVATQSARARVERAQATAASRAMASQVDGA